MEQKLSDGDNFYAFVSRHIKLMPDSDERASCETIQNFCEINVKKLLYKISRPNKYDIKTH